MAMPIRPQHFVSRQDGTLTALVAVDELPSCLSIRNVPRVLNQSDTHGMTSLGTLASRGQIYTVDYVHQGNSFEIAPSAARPSNGEDFAARAHSAGPPIWNASSHPQASLAWRNVDSAGREIAKQNPIPRQGKGQANSNVVKKEYCSFWLRHGECDYQQQGCIFKHEMPTDPATLDKLGLRDIPRWYREKHGLKSIATGGATTLRPDRVWRGDDQATPHAAQHNALPSRHIMPIAPGSDMRCSGQAQYPTTMSGSTHQTSVQTHSNAVNGRDGNSAMHLGTNHAVKDVPNPHRPADRSQLWKRLDLLTQEELPEHPKLTHAPLSLQDGYSGFREQNGAVDYLANDGAPPTSRTPQPAPMEAERASDGKAKGHLRASRPGDSSIWAMREPSGNDISALSMAPFNSAQQTSNQLTEQGGHGKRKNQRSRRLYQCRATTDTSNPSTRAVTDTGKINIDKRKLSPGPPGSTSPGKQSEVKSNNLDGLDGAFDTVEERNKTRDMSSGIPTPDNDPFDLKLE